ncbi:diguanylate cyclase [Pyruvatibacter sp.]|uniref:diguanylate cyclase domain-containing protein n=1 Tax=Pyruvatibacter sp. TaxID=1981328 RepID=UPI003263FD31
MRMSGLAVLLCVGLVYISYVLADTRQEWGTAVELRDPRPIAVSRLRHQLGYGGLVHHYLNSVLRPGQSLEETATFDLGAVRGALLDFQALRMSPLERTALTIINDELDSVYTALEQMERDVYADLTPQEAYARFNVDLERMADAVDMLATVSFGDFGDTPPHHQLLSEFEAAIGLDGIVHHLKAYLLTSDTAHAEQAQESVATATALLQQLRERAVSNAEREAVRIIARTVTDYEAGIAKAIDMMAQGLSPSEIDVAIQVDDMPAISAYATLMSFEMARLERGTEAVGRGIFSAQLAAILLIVLFTIPFIVLFVRISLGLMQVVPQWANTLTAIAEGLAKEEFDKNQDYSGLPTELAALEEPFAAIRRTLWFRKEQALEGEAQVDTMAADTEQLTTKIAGVRDDLRTASKRADEAEKAAAKASKDVDMMGGVIEAMSHGVLATRGFDGILFWNLRLSELLGIPPDWFSRDRSLHELLLYLATRGDFGTGDPMETVQQVISLMGEKLTEGIMRHDLSLKGNAERVLAMEIVRRGDGTIVFSATDITARHELAVAMEQQAISDPLTGLANRTALNDFTSSMLKHAKRSGEKAAILALDLDGFKPINDHYGHGAGDEVLVELSNRLSEEIRETDFVARTGGDEFILVLLHLDDGLGAARFATRLLRAIEMPVRLSSGEDVSVSGSIGISVFPDNAEDLELLYRNADEALYAAKGAGRNCVKTYDEIAVVSEGVEDVAESA